MRLPTVRAHVGVVTCAALAATVLGTPFADVVDAAGLGRGRAIRLSGGEPSAPPVAGARSRSRSLGASRW